MRVRDVLLSDHPLTVDEADPVSVAAQMMAWASVRHLPVLRNRQLVGILSERDVLRGWAEKGRSVDRPVGDVMSKPPRFAQLDDDLASLEARMAQERSGGRRGSAPGRGLGLLTLAYFLSVAVGREQEHPGLAQPVRAVMTPNPQSASADDYLADAAGRMSARGIRHLPVIDGERRLVGMLSDRDVRTAMGEARQALDEGAATARLAALRVEDLMSARPISIGEGEPIQRALDLLVAERVGALPVVDAGERLAGIVSYLDLLTWVRRESLARRTGAAPSARV